MKELKRKKPAGKLAKEPVEMSVLDAWGETEALEKLSQQSQRVKLSTKQKVLAVCGSGALVIGCAAGIDVIIESNNFEHFRANQTQIFEQTQVELAEFYQDEKLEIPKRDLEEHKVEDLEKELDHITFEDYLAEKAEMQDKTGVLHSFVEVRDEIDENLEGENLKSSTSEEKLAKIESDYAGLPAGHQSVLEAQVVRMREQYNRMQDIEVRVRDLFADEQMEKVREDIKRANYDEVMRQYNELPQQDVKDKWHDTLARVETEISRREEEARRLAEEARRKAEEERRKREAAIAAAWHEIHVPHYISQNYAGIYNGCEAASLLMGLQARGYLAGMDFRNYVEMMPKSDDPFQGFVESIYDLEPRNVPHWIAPAPLAAFGRSSSGANVVDMTGASLDQLDAEVKAGHPVVIYLTYLYRTPGAWINGAPKNIHVQLLTGYNEITGQHIIVDPWTNGENAGSGKRYLSRAVIERLYNSTGKRAVVIR